VLCRERRHSKALRVYEAINGVHESFGTVFFRSLKFRFNICWLTYVELLRLNAERLSCGAQQNELGFVVRIIAIRDHRHFAKTRDNFLKGSQSLRD
jgi:hypothetical protein